MDVDFWGVVNGTKAFLPHLIASGDGHVVNISSLFGLLVVPGQSAYNAAKFAVRGFTEALRQEMLVAGHPVQVTCVHPGGIKTAIARNAGAVDGLDAADAGRSSSTPSWPRPRPRGRGQGRSCARSAAQPAPRRWSALDAKCAGLLVGARARPGLPAAGRPPRAAEATAQRSRRAPVPCELISRAGRVVRSGAACPIAALRTSSVQPSLGRAPRAIAIVDGSSTGVLNATSTVYASGSRPSSVASVRALSHMPCAIADGKPNAFAVSACRWIGLRSPDTAA